MLPTPSLFSWGKLVLYIFKVSWLIITIIPTIVQIIKCHFLANVKARSNAEPKLDQSDWGKNVNSMVERGVYSRTKVHVSANHKGCHSDCKAHMKKKKKRKPAKRIMKTWSWSPILLYSMFAVSLYFLLHKKTNSLVV